MKPRYIVIMVWFNGFNEKSAMLIEEDNYPKYFESIDQIKESINPKFPGDTLCINLNTLEIEETL